MIDLLPTPPEISVLLQHLPVISCRQENNKKLQNGIPCAPPQKFRQSAGEMTAFTENRFYKLNQTEPSAVFNPDFRGISPETADSSPDPIS